MKAEKERRRDTGDHPAETGETGDKTVDKIEHPAERTTKICRSTGGITIEREKIRPRDRKLSETREKEWKIQ
jgi:hypothetical protein